MSERPSVAAMRVDPPGRPHEKRHAVEHRLAGDLLIFLARLQGFWKMRRCRQEESREGWDPDLDKLGW